jgi:excisionase family DNA binding protein
MQTLGNVATVSEASATLGIHPSQVRLLIRRGDLAGERLGSQWVISRAELERFSDRSRRAGRPFSERIAWSVLASLEGVEAPWPLAREERSRLRSYAAKSRTDLYRRLRGRASTTRLSVGPYGFEHLSDETTWIRGAVLPGAHTVVYVAESGLETIIEESNAVLDDEQPNLLLRGIDDRWWPFGSFAPGALSWSIVRELDRYDAGDFEVSTGESSMKLLSDRSF